MINTVIGQKVEQTQRFLVDGSRIPVTVITVPNNTVLQVKEVGKHGYAAVQIGMGVKKHANKALLGHSKAASLTTAPQVIKEVRVLEETELPAVGDKVTADSVLHPGDFVSVTGTSKGKGWAGGVKRYGFRGGPRTHGQSDRERAPGSIGQTTTPGRVYRGKRMAGHMGVDQVTLQNLEIVALHPTAFGTQVLVKGLVPGSVKSIVTITKTGENKQFVELLKTAEEEAAVAAEQTDTTAEDPTVEALTETPAEITPATEQAEPVKEESNG